MNVLRSHNYGTWAKVTVLAVVVILIVFFSIQVYFKLSFVDYEYVRYGRVDFADSSISSDESELIEDAIENIDGVIGHSLDLQTGTMLYRIDSRISNVRDVYHQFSYRYSGISTLQVAKTHLDEIP